MTTADTKELLRRYVEYASESAFAELVNRYIDMVYSTALRRVDGDTHTAQDVVQTVFSDLARKARGLPRDVMLGGWLHRHTGFVAGNVLRGERRRKAREEQAAVMNALHATSDADWKQIAPFLDQAIDGLETAERDAIVLRFFERHDFRAVGAALGISDDAAQKRVSRALDKLRVLLGQRGVTLSAGAMGVALAGNAVAAAPVGLAGAVTQTALAAGSMSSFAASFSALFSGTGVKLVLGGGLAAAVGFFVFTQRQDGTNAKPGASSSAGQESKSITRNRTDTAADSAPAVADGLLRLTLLSAVNGQPVPDVPIKYVAWAGTNYIALTSRSGLEGTCDVSYRGQTEQLVLTIELEGFADASVRWHPSRGQTIPAAYTLRLIPPVQFGGRVVDANGQPVARAGIEFSYGDDPEAHSGPEKIGYGSVHVISSKADDAGNWSLNRIPPKLVARVRAYASHREHQNSPWLIVKEDNEALRQLLEGRYDFRLGRAVTLHGVVEGPDGSPVPDAKVFVGGRGDLEGRRTVTSSNGNFTLPGCKPGTNLLSAEAPGFATTTIQIDTTRHTGPYHLSLQAGRHVVLRAVKQNGEPIAGAWFGYDGSRRHSGIDEPLPVQAEFSAYTDADGRAAWEHAPAGELTVQLRARGFMDRYGVKLNSNETEHVFTLLPPLRVAGRAVDDASGQPVRRFRVVCGHPRHEYPGSPVKIWWNGLERFRRDFDKPGFEVTFEEPLSRLWTGGIEHTNLGYVLKFEAEGYAPFVTRIIRPEEVEARFDVRLKASAARMVTVLLPSGEPAADAEVLLASPTLRRFSSPGGFARRHEPESVARLRTDAQGRFRLEPDPTVTHVFIIHPGGYSETTPAWLANSTTVQLQALGRIEGALTAKGLPAAGRKLQLEPDGVQGRSGPSTDGITFETDDLGEFVLPQVPAGRHQLIRLSPYVRNGKESWRHVPLGYIDIGAGELKRIILEEGPDPITN